MEVKRLNLQNYIDIFESHLHLVVYSNSGKMNYTRNLKKDIFSYRDACHHLTLILVLPQFYFVMIRQLNTY